MDKQFFMEWLRENFSLDGTTQRIIENILDYAEIIPKEKRYAALTEMLSGIGLTDLEIQQISL